MNRQHLFILEEGEGSTFEKDNDLPPFPLPKLDDTLERYYETLKPFGTQEELKNSRAIIDEFRNGIGRKLHKIIEDKAAKEKNWVEKWWELYAYYNMRLPLYPYSVMAMPVLLDTIGISETTENSLKIAARCAYFSLEYWDLARRERLKPFSSSDGNVAYSSYLWRRFFCTSRIPGEEFDDVVSYFRTISQGGGPMHVIITGKGRMFQVNCLNYDGSLLTPQQLLAIFRNIRGQLDSESVGDCVPVLTCDDRTSWAKNRNYLKELSPENKKFIEIVESSILIIALDENEPVDYSEVSQLALAGDFHSKWADRSSILTVYKNGKLACIGEHSCYDGTISINFGIFMLLSFFEMPEPDWTAVPTVIPPATEIKFVIDDNIKTNIERVLEDCDSRRNDVIVVQHIFNGFGKDLMKSSKMHPDAFVQVLLQLTYYKMHNEFAPTYETALMRQYYNGRTETLRSCTIDCANFVKAASDPTSSKKSILQHLRAATNTHNKKMAEARLGKGVDRHLFGLWCAAYENNIDIPDLYSDPLYMKSGGGGNFVLSTSTLGYTINTGFVAPMTIDGYGVFYSITGDAINMIITAYRGSPKSSAHKFAKFFDENMTKIKAIIEELIVSKL